MIQASCSNRLPCVSKQDLEQLGSFSNRTRVKKRIVDLSCQTLCPHARGIGLWFTGLLFWQVSFDALVSAI